jgi:hypothetical protein
MPTKLKPIAKLKAAKIKLKQLVKAARDAGAEVTVTFDPHEKRMPMRFPDDPEIVTLLLDESERVNALGNRWAKAKIPNIVAAQKCLEMGWAHALSAVWLRCKLKGELQPDLRGPLAPWMTTVTFKGPEKSKAKKKK